MAVTQIDTSFNYDEKTSILLYGPPGSGKTWFGGHMPKNFFISLDKNGTIGLKRHGIPFEGVEVDTYEDVQNVIYDIGMGKRARGRETLVLDHLGLLGEACLNKALIESNKKRADLNVWGITVDHLRLILKQLLDLQKNFHILVLAHEQIEKNEVRGGVFGTPHTIGKFAYHVGGMFDLFLYAEQEVTWKNGNQVPQWLIHTIDYLDFKAKDRLGVLDVVEPNDAEALLGKIYSH